MQQTTTHPNKSTFRSTPTTLIFEGQPSKTRPFPWWKVLLVLGTYTLIFQFPIFFGTTQLPIYQGFPRLSTRFPIFGNLEGKTRVFGSPPSPGAEARPFPALRRWRRCQTPRPNSQGYQSDPTTHWRWKNGCYQRNLEIFGANEKKIGPGGLGYKL